MFSLVEFSKALLSDTSLQEQKIINDSLLPLINQGNASLHRKLQCLLLLGSTNFPLTEESTENIKTNWNKILTIIEEHDIKLPEEEIAIESAMKSIAEEGEAPTNVSAGIDASTPRIYPKKQKKEKEDDSSIIVP